MKCVTFSGYFPEAHIFLAFVEAESLFDFLFLLLRLECVPVHLSLVGDLSLEILSHLSTFVILHAIVHPLTMDEFGAEFAIDADTSVSVPAF